MKLKTKKMHVFVLFCFAFWTNKQNWLYKHTRINYTTQTTIHMTNIQTNTTDDISKFNYCYYYQSVKRRIEETWKVIFYFSSVLNFAGFVEEELDERLALALTISITTTTTKFYFQKNVFKIKCTSSQNIFLDKSSLPV